MIYTCAVQDVNSQNMFPCHHWRMEPTLGSTVGMAIHNLRPCSKSFWTDEITLATGPSPPGRLHAHTVRPLYRPGGEGLAARLMGKMLKGELYSQGIAGHGIPHAITALYFNTSQRHLEIVS